MPILAGLCCHAAGRVIAQGKEELIRILDSFNIQVGALDSGREGDREKEEREQMRGRVGERRKRDDRGDRG